jgi:hypothetical protein
MGRRATPSSRQPASLDARSLKAHARSRAANAPARLLAQIDQFSSMGGWTLVSAPSAKIGWSPPARFTVVDGNMAVGKLVVHGPSDFGIAIVVGDITCTSLEVKSGWTLVCTGAVTAKGTVTATASGSATYVGGALTAKLVKSGSGAWLTLFGGEGALKAKVSDYVMIDGVGPLRDRSPA